MEGKVGLKEGGRGEGVRKKEEGKEKVKLKCKTLTRNVRRDG